MIQCTLPLQSVCQNECFLLNHGDLGEVKRTQRTDNELFRLRDLRNFSVYYVVKTN